MALERLRKGNGAADVRKEAVWDGERRRQEGGKAGGPVLVESEPSSLFSKVTDPHVPSQQRPRWVQHVRMQAHCASNWVNMSEQSQPRHQSG